VTPSRSPRYELSPALGFMAAGGLLLGLSGSGVFPAAFLAERVSVDQSLSPEFRQLLQWSQWILAILCLLVAGFALVARRIADGVLTGLTNMRAARFYGLLALLGFGFSLTLEFALFQAIPHITDGASHLFQAKILALGRWSAPVPPCPESFFVDNLILGTDGQWHTKYFPGQALWLLAGVAIGAPWLCMPLATALSAIALSFVAERVFGRVPGRATGLLFAWSPLTLLLGASYMSHSTFLCFAFGGAALLFLGSRRPLHDGRRRWAAAGAGLCFGMAAITRPQDFVAFLVIGGVAWVLIPASARPFRVSDGLLGSAGFLAVLALLLFWNHQLYGSFIATGYYFSETKAVIPVKHDSIGFSSDYTPVRAVRHTLWTLLRFNKAALGWPSSLLPALFAFLPGRWDRRHVLCAVAIVVVVILYLFFPYYGFEYEARYYAPALPFLIVLTLAGFQNGYGALASLLERRLGATRGRSHARSLIASLFLLFVLHGLFYYWPFYLWPRYARDYQQVSDVVHRQVREQRLEQAVVLIPGENERGPRYLSGFVYNDPLLENEVVYARDLDKERECLRKAFPGRAFYRFVPDEKWEDGRVVEVVGGY